MEVVKQYIAMYNGLHKCTVYKNDIVQLLAEVKEVNNPHLKEVEQRLSVIASRMNGKPVIISIDNPIKLPVVKKKKTRVVKPSKPKRESKRSLPPVKRNGGNKVTIEGKKSAAPLNGFTPADQIPEETKNLMPPLKDEIGIFLQRLQRYKLLFILAGEYSSGKSEIAKQICNSLIAATGEDVAWLDWEQGGAESTDTKKSIDRNISPENKKHFHVEHRVKKNLDAVKALTKRYKIIALDSATKLGLKTNDWIEELREEFPDVIWILIFQLNASGKTRGGSSAEFDAPVVIFTWRPDITDYKKNYAELMKNRGNNTGLKYLIAAKKIFNPEVG